MCLFIFSHGQLNIFASTKYFILLIISDLATDRRPNSQPHGADSIFEGCCWCCCLIFLKLRMEPMIDKWLTNRDNRSYLIYVKIICFYAKVNIHSFHFFMVQNFDNHLFQSNIRDQRILLTILHFPYGCSIGIYLIKE